MKKKSDKLDIFDWDEWHKYMHDFTMQTIFGKTPKKCQSSTGQRQRKQAKTK